MPDPLREFEAEPGKRNVAQLQRYFRGQATLLEGYGAHEVTNLP